ncbi:MAG: diguanylate cyclase [Thermoguttaceae bacterium]|jgi:two-component system cell cycle response regulator
MNVLIVSDDRGLLRHVSRFLTTFGYETVQVADYQRAAEIAEAAAADLVIVDSDPDFAKALAFSRTVSGNDRADRRQILMLVAEASMGRLAEAMEAGADDFLAKPIVYGEVLMRLRAGVRAVEFQRRARRQRYRDPITGLLSSAAFHDRLQSAADSKASGSGQLACVMIDADFLQFIGRKWGKDVENGILRQLGTVLERLCDNRRAEIAHFGKGRFCVLLPGASVAEAASWAELVRAKVAERPLAEDAEIRITVSIGVAGVNRFTNSAASLLAMAEQALQSAKTSGHDLVARYGQFAEETAVWKELAAPGKLFERTVAGDVMIPCTMAIRAGDTIESAAALFRQTRLGSLVVVDESGRLAGTISSEAVSEILPGGAKRAVGEVMARDVEAFPEDASFERLMVHFAENDCDLVVIVDRGHPTGLVTPASLASLSQSPECPAAAAQPSMWSHYLEIPQPPCGASYERQF